MRVKCIRSSISPLNNLQLQKLIYYSRYRTYSCQILIYRALMKTDITDILPANLICFFHLKRDSAELLCTLKRF
jgi:hypothetical protein